MIANPYCLRPLPLPLPSYAVAEILASPPVVAAHLTGPSPSVGSSYKHGQYAACATAWFSDPASESVRAALSAGLVEMPSHVTVRNIVCVDDPRSSLSIMHRTYPRVFELFEVVFMSLHLLHPATWHFFRSRQKPELSDSASLQGRMEHLQVVPKM